MSHRKFERPRHGSLSFLPKKRARSIKPDFSVSNTGFTDEDLEKLRSRSDVIRILAHTQPAKISCLKTKKASILEIQVNGGSVTDKVEFALEKLEKEINITDSFNVDEFIDVLGVTKGKGFKGVVSRGHIPKLPRKTNKGVNKVGCIGAWHPARVSYTIARAGQKGFHRRTQKNLAIYGAGCGTEMVKTEFDLTLKTVNPMGGFPNYGNIKNNYLMVKGSTVGPKKRNLVIRKALAPNMKKSRKTVLKFIDTSSKIGRGRFQTLAEKNDYYNISKDSVIAAAGEQEISFNN